MQIFVYFQLEKRNKELPLGGWDLGSGNLRQKSLKPTPIYDVESTNRKYKFFRIFRWFEQFSR